MVSLVVEQISPKDLAGVRFLHRPQMEKINKKELKMNPEFEIVYQGNIFEVVRWEGKPGVMFEAAVRSPGVRLLIECEKNNKKALLMTKEIRREAGGWDYRLPGGKVFDSLEELNKSRKENINISEKALETAKKEGREEAGLLEGDFSEIGISKSGSSVEWDLYYYLVKNSKIGDQELEENEQGDIEQIIFSAEEIFEKLKNGEIQEGRSADMIWSWLTKNNFIKFSE